MRGHIIKNNHLELHTSPTGAAMTALFVKDDRGRSTNVIYGYREPERYLRNPFFMGATCGRYAGRIGGHAFSIADQRYPLESEGRVHLHGGTQSLAFREWTLKQIDHGTTPKIVYEIQSEHLDGGYPGNLLVEARYSLHKHTLQIAFSAQCDRATFLNLTNHNYYNLEGGGSISDHMLYLNAQAILHTDADQVPTGELTDIRNTPFDHSSEKKLGETLRSRSLDHVYVVGEQQPQAVLYAPASGLEMRMSTNQPGIVVFTPEDLGEGTFRNSAPGHFPAICLEAQNFPNAPNIDTFPSALLEPGKTYTNLIRLEFTTRREPLE